MDGKKLIRTALSASLPVMAGYVVFCLKTVSFAELGGWLPALIACAVVALLHLWRRSTLISIVCGTVCYMLLVQMVF